MGCPILTLAETEKRNWEYCNVSTQTVWWKTEAAPASSVLLLGSGTVVDRAKAVCEALKLPVEIGDPAKKSLREMLDPDPTRAVFLFLETERDPSFDLVQKSRASKELRSRRIVLGLASAGSALLQKAFTLPPTGIWLPPHGATLLADLLLKPKRVA